MLDEIYPRRALEYAETYGIIDYEISGNKMIFYQNYSDDVHPVSGKRISYTMKRIVDLDIMRIIKNQRLKRLNKRGWNNV